VKNGASDGREVERRGGERSMRSRKMKDFSLRVFDSKTETIKEIQENVITTKKLRIRSRKRFVLGNEKSIVYERKN